MLLNLNLLHLVGYLATGLGFCFMVLSLACGLYYLAELVEEYTVYTKKVIKYMTIVVVALHVLLCIFDRLPVLQLLFSIFCHGVYSLNLTTFPFIQLTSLPFISSCVLVFVDHFIWFKYFTRYYRPFMDVASFFGVCVWLIPFTYFISLSANDNALPMSDPNAEVTPGQQKKGLFKSVFGFLKSNQDQGLDTPAMPMPPNRQSTPIQDMSRPMTPGNAYGSQPSYTQPAAYMSPSHTAYQDQPQHIPPASVISSYSSRSAYSTTSNHLQNRKTA